MKILIATTNAGKIEAAKKAMERFFDNVEIVGYKTESNVPDQPVDLDIYKGAKNRVKNLKSFAKQNNIEADLFVSVESGITNLLGEWMITNVAVVEDDKDFASFGTSPSFPVPERHVKEIIESDLSQVMNKILWEDQERRNHGGAIEILTHGNLSRIDISEMAFIMALTKYINGDIWR